MFFKKSSKMKKKKMRRGRGRRDENEARGKLPHPWGWMFFTLGVSGSNLGWGRKLKMKHWISIFFIILFFVLLLFLFFFQALSTSLSHKPYFRIDILTACPGFEPTTSRARTLQMNHGYYLLDYEWFIIFFFYGRSFT